MDVMNRELTFNFLQKFVATFLKIKLKTYAKTETKLSRSFSQLLIDDKLNVMDASTLEVIDGVMTVTLRNVAFAQNIAKLYCENALNSGRELVVSLGAEHAEAQRYLLEKIFKSGKVSPVIKFKPLATDYMAMTPEQRKSKLKKDFGEIRLVK
jgi:polyhydroxyalkanoate synthesis regulator protein